MIKSFVPQRVAIDQLVKHCEDLTAWKISDAEWRVARKLIPVLQVSHPLCVCACVLVLMNFSIGFS